MGDVQRSARSSGDVFGGASAGTLALVAAGIIALIVAAGLMFDRYATLQAGAEQAGPPVSLNADAQSLRLLTQISGQQVATRRDLAELREAILAQPRQQRAEETADPRQCPVCDRPNAGPVLDRIDRYLATIDGHGRALLPAIGGRDRSSNVEWTEIGTHYEMLIATIAEARAYVRAQRRALAASAPEGQQELLLASLAPPERASVEGPSAAGLAWMRFYIVVGMFAVLSIVFLVAAIGMFIAADPATASFARDTVKTMLGFFIGVITAFMSGPA